MLIFSTSVSLAPSFSLRCFSIFLPFSSDDLFDFIRIAEGCQNKVLWVKQSLFILIFMLEYQSISFKNPIVSCLLMNIPKFNKTNEQLYSPINLKYYPFL